MIKIQEIGKIKSLTACRFCDGSGFNDWEKQKHITLYGRKPDEILDIIDFAIKNGYKENEKN